jgi:hypothetical protein
VRRRWSRLAGGLLVGAAALALAVAGLAVAASGPLVTRSSKEGGFTVKVPSSWHYKDASYPSDHSTELWTDPADPKSKLEVEVSGCVGCVERQSCVLHNKRCGPFPAGVVPKGTISESMVDPWSVQFVARGAGTPYKDRGLVVIRHDGNKISDWAYVQLWLPDSQKQLADAILASFASG